MILLRALPFLVWFAWQYEIRAWVFADMPGGDHFDTAFRVVWPGLAAVPATAVTFAAVFGLYWVIFGRLPG